jgi:hypothetical protein
MNFRRFQIIILTKYGDPQRPKIVFNPGLRTPNLYFGHYGQGWIYIREKKLKPSNNSKSLS